MIMSIILNPLVKKLYKIIGSQKNAYVFNIMA